MGNSIHLYGTTFGGGSGGGGTIYRVNLTSFYSVTENTANLLNPLTNDLLWTTGGSLNLASTSTTNGTAIISGSSILVLPATNFTGSATLVYTFTDGAGQTNTSLIALLVTNIPPMANPDSYAVTENTTNTFSPLANDQVQTPGGVLSLVALSPTNGTAVISGPNVIFTPALDFVGTATIGYTVTDNIGGTNSSLITVTVTVPAQADLSLSAGALPEPVGINSNLVYSLIVSNAGPSAATGVVISNQIPAGVNFISATGGATPTNGVLLMNLGSLAAGAGETAQIVLQPTVAGGLTNMFQVFQVGGATNNFNTNVTATVVSTVKNAVVAEIIPGTPLTILGSNPGASTIFCRGYVSGITPINGEMVGNFTNLTEEPGDLIVLNDFTGGNDPTNWLAVVRYFNPADPTGVNGLSATYSEPFFATSLGGNGFAGLTLFPNTYFTGGGVSSSNGIIVGSVTVAQFGPAGAIVAGQMAVITTIVTGYYTDLSLGASAAPEPVTVGNDLTFSLSVSNGGFATATNVVISNQIPAGVNFVSATGGATPTNGVLVLNLGSLAVGATGTAQIVLQPTVAGQLTNVFQVSSDLLDPVLSNNTATVVSTVTNAAVALAIPGTGLTVSGDLGSGISGDPGAFGGSGIVFGTGPIQEGYGSVENSNGAIDLLECTNIVVFTASPGDLILLNDPSGGNNPTNWLAVVRYFNPADPTGSNGLAATYSEAFFATNFGGAGFANFQLFPNTYYVTDDGYTTTNGVTTFFAAIEEFGPAGIFLAGESCISLVTITPTFTDLSLDASATPESVTAGQDVTYSLSVSNGGDMTATDVVISNQIPAGVNFVSATGGATPTNGVLVLNLGSLAVGATGTAQIVLQPTVAGQLTNVFQVSSDLLDPVLSNNLATVVSTVTNAVISGIIPGTPLTILGSNPGGSTITLQEVVSGTTPIDGSYYNGILGFTFLTAEPGDLILLNDPSGGNNPTNWLAVVRNFNPADPTGANGLAATYSEAFIATSLGGSGFAGLTLFPNTDYVPASVPSGSPTIVGITTQFGPAGVIYAGQTAITEIIVGLVPDLSFSASATPEPVTVGGNLVYSLAVSNGGPVQATDVVISNQIPAGVNFVSATGGATPTNGILVLNLDPLAAGAAESAQIVVQPTVADQLTNVFQLSSTILYLRSSNTTATVVSTVTDATVNSADLNLSASALPEPVGISSNLVYSLIISNAGPSAATSVIISNQFPVGLNFVSATGGARPSGGILLVNLGSLAAGETSAAQVIVQPTSAGKFTNLFSVFSSVTDPVLVNNSASVVSTVTNAPALPVDVALSLVAAPNPVAVGSPLTYSLTVTNNSSTTATGVVVSNTLPVNVTLFSLLPSQGSATNQAGIVTYSVGNLPNGNAATLVIVVLPQAAGSLTNTAVASSAQTDSQPGNNRVTNITTAVSVPITNLVLTVLTTMTLNPQTGLFEQSVEVANGGPSTPSSVLVEVSGLAANAKLYNAIGTTNGLPYVQSAMPLGVGSNVVFLLEYYVPTRVMPTNLTYTVVAGPPFIPPVVNGTIMSISQMTVLPNGNVLVEFTAIPGQVYAIQYSSDMKTWQTAVPVITAPANRVQWIDAGPPQTASSPAGQPERYYRVVQLPAK